MPIVENGTCIIPTEINIAFGDSGNFGPCHIADNYVRDYICIPCNGPSDYIDY